MTTYDIVRPYTMTSKERINSLEEKIAYVNLHNIEGSMVECGVWKCGMLGVMSITNRNFAVNRSIFGFDSFQGMPKPNMQIDGNESVSWEKTLAISVTEAERNLSLMGCHDVQLCKGFFEESIPIWKSKLGSIAILRLDGDWYSSTITCLRLLYDVVTPGGFVIIDDYGHWPGCKIAVDEFRNFNNIVSPLIQTDYTEFWWSKSNSI